MAKKISVFLTIFTVITIIVIFVLQGIENNRIKGTNTIRLHTRISDQHSIPEWINENNPDFTISFYQKNHSGEWEKIIFPITDDGKFELDMKKLSVDGFFNCNELGKSISDKNTKATYTSIMFTPKQTGEYKYIIFLNDKEIYFEEYNIINQTLWYYVKNLFLQFILAPLSILFVAPIRWLTDRELSTQIGNILFGSGVLPFILIVLSVIAVLIVLLILICKTSNLCRNNEPSEEECDNYGSLFIIFRLSIYLGMFFTVLLMHSVNYLEDVMGYTELDVSFALMGYAIPAFIALIKSIIAIIRKKISAFRFVHVILISTFTSACMCLGALAVFVFIVIVLIRSIFSGFKKHNETYTTSYFLALTHRNYNPDVDEDEDTLDVAKRPEYMLSAAYINHEIKKAEKQDKDDDDE